MKKCAKLFTPLCLLACLTLASCELLAAAHTHDFQTEWTNDETHHWQTCKDETCTEISGKAEHDFKNDVCSVCGYTLPPKTTVTEEEFNVALSFENVDSYTLAINGEDRLYITGNKANYTENDNEAYIESFEGYVDVYYQEDDAWLKLKVLPEDEMYERAYMLLNFEDVMFTDMSFDDFTYENGVYTGSNCSLRFENGQLVSFTTQTIADSEDLTYEDLVFTFKNYNTTTVTLPDAQYKGAVTREEFETAMSLENVDSLRIKADGEEIYSRSGYKVKTLLGNDLIYLEFHETYIDFYYSRYGTEWFKEKVLPEDRMYIELIHASVLDSSLLNSFSFSSFTYNNGVYTKESNSATTILEFKDGKIISLTDQDHNDDTTTVFTFEDYNNTTVTLPTEYTEVS